MQNQMAIQELDFAELGEVSGGVDSGDALTAAVGFAVGGATLAVSAPLVAGALLVGSIVSSGVSIYYTLNE